MTTPADYIVMQIHFCAKCARNTAHGMLYEIVGGRWFAKCGVCRRAHSVRPEHQVIEP